MKNKWQKLPSRGVLRKRCSENIQVCRRTPMQNSISIELQAILLKPRFGMGLLL